MATDAVEFQETTDMQVSTGAGKTWNTIGDNRCTSVAYPPQLTQWGGYFHFLESLFFRPLHIRYYISCWSFSWLLYFFHGHEEGAGAYSSCIEVKAEYNPTWVAISSKSPVRNWGLLALNSLGSAPGTLRHLPDSFVKKWMCLGSSPGLGRTK